MRGRLTISIVLVQMALLSVGRAQGVVRSPEKNLSLAEQWTWASHEGLRSIDAKECWIGYSIKRLMDDNSFVSSGRFSSDRGESGRTLRDLVAGDSSRHTHGSLLSAGSGRSSIIKVLKDIALLFEVRKDAGVGRSVLKVEMTDMDLCANLNGKRLIWLGEHDDDQSVKFLSQMFTDQSSLDLKRELVVAVGMHQHSTLTLPFLVGTLNGDQDENIRSQAAFWIGQQDLPACLPVLIQSAQHDRSIKVKEQSVFAISQLSSESSTEALIDLARKSEDPRVRAKAAFWLGQKASKKAVATLESIIDDTETTEVQRQVLFALARIHTAEVLDRLIKIAQTHANPRIRKTAIQCLGQSDDPRALEALINIVRN